MAKRELTPEQKEELRERMKKARETRMKNLQKKRREENKAEKALIADATPIKHNAIVGENNLDSEEVTIERITEVEDKNKADLEDNSNRGTTDTEALQAVRNEKMSVDTSETENSTSHNIETTSNPSNGTVTMTDEQFQMLLQAFQSGERVKSSGSTGVTEKTSINSSNYPNPVEELYDIPELKRFNLRDNYVIEYKFGTAKYETRQGEWYVEPKFQLTLKKKQFDSVTGEELVKKRPDGTTFKPRVVIGSAVFFEDAPANIEQAELAGIEISDIDDKSFADKMRMWRYKGWIIERINPRPVITTTNHTREEVIGGKVYQIDEYSDFVE